MRTPYSVLLLTCLGACASNAARPGAPMPATFAEVSPSTPAESQRGEGNAPKDTMLAVGAGFSTSPSGFLLSSTLDFPMDTDLTAGPSLQYGADDDHSLVLLSGQLKYFLGLTEIGSLSVRPYVTGGIGLASIDKEGRGGDSGLFLNLGGGLRYLTGENYRIGSEARLNILPGEIGGESTLLTIDLLQVTFEF